MYYLKHNDTKDTPRILTPFPILVQVIKFSTQPFHNVQS